MMGTGTFSQSQFTPNVLFDDKNILDKDTILSRNFTFQTFQERQTKAASDYAARKGFMKYLHRAKATIKTALKGGTNLQFNIEDSEDWTRVLELIRHTNPHGKKAIYVNLDIKWSRFPPNGRTFDDPSAEEDELDELDEDLTLPPLVNKKRKTVTHALVEQARLEESVRDERSILLRKAWMCDKRDCSNNNNWCYRKKDQDGTWGPHFKLLNNHLTDWVNAIHSGRATIEDPPESLNS